MQQMSSFWLKKITMVKEKKVNKLHKLLFKVWAKY